MCLSRINRERTERARSCYTWKYYLSDGSSRTFGQWYIHREEDCTNELPCDNNQRTGKTFEDGKKRTKQQVLITSKGNYIEHWEKARYVSRHYKKYFRI